MELCNQRKLNEILQAFNSSMKSVFNENLKQVLLYGSYARGDFDVESDIDVMVIVDLHRTEIHEYYEEISKIISKIDLEFDVVLSPVFKSFSEFMKYKNVIPFLQNVEREGVTISAWTRKNWLNKL